MGLIVVDNARQCLHETAAGSWDGEGTVTLTDRASGLAATIVPGIGSNLISLSHPATGREFIYGPKTAAELRNRSAGYGHPALLPPNRIREGRFSFAGRVYRLPLNRPPHHIHGLVHGLRWRVAGSGAGAERGAWVRTVMDGREYPEFKAVFPQDFSLIFQFSLRAGVLRLEIEAVNRGPGPFPFGLGFHTYFRLPMRDGEDPGAYRLTLPAEKRWELVDCFPTGAVAPLAPGDRLDGVLLAGLRLDDVYTDLAPGEPEIAAAIQHESTGCGIVFASGREFPHWVVWTGPGPGAPFICLEPYTCVTDAPNLPLPPEATGLVALAEGACWRGWLEFRPDVCKTGV